MKCVNLFIVIMNGIKVNKKCNKGFISYMVLIIGLLSILGATVLWELARVNESVVRDELALIDTRYGVERGFQWFYLYTQNRGAVEERQYFEVEHSDDISVYIQVGSNYDNTPFAIVHSINRNSHRSSRGKIEFHKDSTSGLYVIDKMYPY